MIKTLQVTKTPQEEIAYLGQMLGATMPNDIKRILSISTRLVEIAREELPDGM